MTENKRTWLDVKARPKNVCVFVFICDSSARERNDFACLECLGETNNKNKKICALKKTIFILQQIWICLSILVLSVLFFGYSELDGFSYWARDEFMTFLNVLSLSFSCLSARSITFVVLVSNKTKRLNKL